MSLNSNGNAVVDSTALAALEVPSVIEPGTTVFNEDVGANFVYTISTAALVPDEVVAVAGITGARWIKYAAANAATADAPTDADTFADDLGLGWVALASRTIRAIDPTIVRAALVSNCVNLSDFALTAATGTGTILNTPVVGGGILVSSGVTASSLQIGQLGSTSAARIAANMRANHYAVYARIKYVTPPGATGQQMVVCCITDGTNDWNLGSASAVSQANYTFGNQAATPVDTGVAIDANWHDFLILNDGTHLTAYIDGVQVGQVLSSGLATSTGFSRVFSYNGGASAVVSFAMTRWAVFTAEAP